MPTHKQTTVESVTSEYGLGDSDTSTLKEMFSASPIYSGEITDAVVRTMGNDLLITGEVNDGGHTFGTFSRDYEDSPDYGDVAVGGGGLPGSAHTPNPTSPGPGSINPSDQKDPPDGWPPPPGVEYGTGEGSQLSPDVSSQKISSQTIGDYLFGRSSKD